MTMIDDEAPALDFTKTGSKNVQFGQDETPVFSGKTTSDAKFPVPNDEAFGTQEFMAESNLTALVHSLIETKANLAHLKGFQVTVVWKRKGGEKGGKHQFGAPSKPTGWLRQVTEDDFFIWLAADHCRELSRTEIEMVAFEQLCACGKNDQGERVLLPPDFKGYIAVVREYGAATAELREVKKALQLGLGI